MIPGTELSHTHLTYEQSPVGLSGSMGVHTKILSSQTNNLLTGAVSHVQNQWDSYGNITQVSETVNTDLQVTLTENQYGTFGPSLIPNRVVATQRTTTRIGQDPVSESLALAYDAVGGLSESVLHPGAELAVFTRIDRNAYGAVIRETVSAPSLPQNDLLTEFAYDQAGRFLITKTVWWNKNGNLVPIVDKYVHDGRWGAVTSHITPDGLTTLWSHDTWGRVNETQIPHLAGALRHAITHTRSWALDASTGQTHVVSVHEPGTSPSEQYFNATGQLLRTRAAVNQPGSWTESTRAYNYKGQLILTTEPHLSDEAFYTVAYEYDDLGQVVREVNSFFGETTLVRSYPGNGQVVQVTTTPDQEVRTTKTDATGLVMVAEDAGGVLEYSYDSRGAQTKVKVNNYTTALMQYDQYGRQISLTDPNTGMTHYKYDAFGNLIYMRDADDNETSYTFDNLGRPLSRTEPEGQTHWKYFHDGPKVMDAPVEISGPSCVITFEYTDPYLRLTRKTEIIEGVPYSHRFTYDDNDRMTGQGFPSGLDIA